MKHEPTRQLPERGLGWSDAKPPLLRFLLIRLSAEEHRLVLTGNPLDDTAHQIIAPQLTARAAADLHQRTKICTS